MLALSFRRAYVISDKIIIRQLRSRKVNFNNPNPGLNHRLQAFQNEGLQIEDNDAEEFVEQSGSEFYNAGEAYKEHVIETYKGKQDLRHHIVKNKYFKDNLPNFLTWSEKEQIRHLAQTQSDEWTPERIAESFPVTVPIVKKLLKYPWKPATEQRIQRHDESAMRNWRELKEGTLGIPQDLRQHILKFSERSIPPLNKNSIKIDVTPNDVEMGEFERIIQRCAAKEERNTTDTDSSTCENESKQFDDNNEKMRLPKDKSRTTLEELTSKIKKRLDSGADINLPDKVLLSTVNTSVPANIEKSYNQVDLDIKQDTTELTPQSTNDTNTLQPIEYPERIRIPKKAYKKGATYKVNDCFYDDHGKFIYRVIGMTN